MAKDTADPSMSSSGTRASSSAPSCCPHLTKKTVANAILKLGDAHGSTMQSILTNLQSRLGFETVTRVQLEIAIDRLKKDNLVRVVREERFSLSDNAKKSAVKAQKTTKTKRASTASPSVASSTVAKVRAARTTKAADVKTRSTSAVAVKTRPAKSRSVAVSLVGKQSSTAITSSSPRKADCDRDVGSAQVPNSCRHEKPRRLTLGNADVVMVDIPPEGSKMDVDAEPGITRGVDENNSTDTDNMEGDRTSFMKTVSCTDVTDV